MSVSPTLLTDAEIRRFITDGYLVLPTDVPAEVHRQIDERLLWVLHNEWNPGNNILPAVPEMQHVLDSPRVRGALASVLGTNYVLHPHRYVHNNEPGEMTAEGARMGKGSHSFIGWHQDSQSPLARPRHHFPHYAMILYYPQDTPIERGPTQLIPATHHHRRLSDADRARGFPAAGPAGTCVLVHFDIAHGGTFNASDRTRNMAKFVFARVEEPTAPSWDCRERAWQTPPDHQAPFETPVVWSRIWNWLSGNETGVSGQNSVETPDDASRIPALIADMAEDRPLETRVRAANALATYGASAADAIPALMNAMEGEEPLRQSAIYTLAALGAPAVGPLCAHLHGRVRNGWSEGAVVMENSAYALAALGSPAIPALITLLESKSGWIQSNAAFALGEMGARAADAVPALTRLLRHQAHPVVRTAVDALGQIRTGTKIALPEIERLLTQRNPDWEIPLLRAWTGQDQVRLNAMMALLKIGNDTPEAEEIVAKSLDDPCGYVGGFGVEWLARYGSPSGVRRALGYLQTHRWDNTLKQGVRTY